ncbi:MAG: 6-carboxytetrahydropterin synthase QueD [Ruminococcus sp.]|nr:6-carboxytetrahydropterin synthase QueD [Ruminococcus sp.]
MYRLKTSASFDSAHFLAGYVGKCANIHGHRWTIEVTAGSDSLIEEGAKKGMVIDFHDFKHQVRKLAKSFDHTLIFEKGALREKTLEALNEEGFSLMEVDFRPTAENFAEYFYKKLAESGLPVCTVAVYETPDNCAVYGEDKP